jgi:hypothetical protein
MHVNPAKKFQPLKTPGTVQVFAKRTLKHARLVSPVCAFSLLQKHEILLVLCQVQFSKIVPEGEEGKTDNGRLVKRKKKKKNCTGFQS